MEINKNRIVKMSLDGTDWRNFLDSATDGFINDNELLGGVSQSVYLLMDSTTPRYKTANTYDTGVANLFKTIGNTADSFTKNIPVLGPVMSSLGIKATDLASAFLDIGTAIMNPTENGVSKAWNPWFMNAPTWEGISSTLSFQYTFRFAMGQYGLWDAREEVMKPILNLLAPTMVQEIKTFTMLGPYKRTIDVLKNMANDALDSLVKSIALSDTDDNSTDNPFTNLLDKTLDIDFGGSLHLKGVLLKNSDVVFSSEVDENGYPISGSVTLDFATVVPQARKAPNGLVSMSFGTPYSINGSTTPDKPTPPKSKTDNSKNKNL